MTSFNLLLFKQSPYSLQCSSPLSLRCCFSFTAIKRGWMAWFDGLCHGWSLNLDLLVDGFIADHLTARTEAQVHRIAQMIDYHRVRVQSCHLSRHQSGAGHPVTSLVSRWRPIRRIYPDNDSRVEPSHQSGQSACGRVRCSEIVAVLRRHLIT